MATKSRTTNLRGPMYRQRRWRPGDTLTALPDEVVAWIREQRAAEPGPGLKDTVDDGVRRARAALDHYLLLLYLNGWSTSVLAAAYGGVSRQTIHNRLQRAETNPPAGAVVPEVPLLPPTRAEVARREAEARRPRKLLLSPAAAAQLRRLADDLELVTAYSSDDVVDAAVHLTATLDRLNRQGVSYADLDRACGRHYGFAHHRLARYGYRHRSDSVRQNTYITRKLAR